MIHPNEWNNIPACIRSAVMGLIDFNDTITQKVITEHQLLQQKITTQNENTIRLKSTLNQKIDGVDNKIDKEIARAFKKLEKNNEFLSTQYSQLQGAQIAIDSQLRTMTHSMSEWEKKMGSLVSKIEETEEIANKVQAEGKEAVEAVNLLVTELQS